MNNKTGILTVSNVNQYIKSLLMYDMNLSSVSVRGEISNFKRYSSGHAYFSLKDATGILKCVIFQSNFVKLDFKPGDGMNVVATGGINVYERDGVYQLYVQNMVPDGLGSLFERFEALKLQLGKEGLFEASHKRPIPKLPKAVGVVTSPSGAVIEDIRNVTKRRFPDMPIVLYPASVQGVGSSEEIVRGIERANKEGLVDVLIVGRGGGSIEDLWSFNEENVARAVFSSKIPVISAVGHETDFTICDFVADLRAPTPSAAAELAVPELEELKASLLTFEKKLRSLPKQNILVKQTRLERLAAYRFFTHPQTLLDKRNEDLMHREDRLTRSFHQIFSSCQLRLTTGEARLSLLNPGKVLKRGYAIVRNTEGHVLTSTHDFIQPQSGEIMVQDGSIQVQISPRSTKGENKYGTN